VKHRHTRIAVSAVAILGLAMGASIIGAGSAHAVVNVWNCTELTPSFTVPGEVDGSFCQVDSGGQGILELGGTQEYYCASFHRILESSPSMGNWWDVTAEGCALIL
jgi:hypothetical protein